MTGRWVQCDIGQVVSGLGLINTLPQLLFQTQVVSTNPNRAGGFDITGSWITLQSGGAITEFAGFMVPSAPAYWWTLGLEDTVGTLLDARVSVSGFLFGAMFSYGSNQGTQDLALANIYGIVE
jgi:hypothetical protein